MATRTEEIYIPCECRVSIFFPAGHSVYFGDSKRYAADGDRR